jgi:hypothetical protein
MSDRFFDSPLWRFAVSDLSFQILTLLDGIATDRRVTVTLNAAAVAEGRCPAENPKANIPHTDGHAYLSEGDRILWCYRREGTIGVSVPWVLRHAGIIGQVKPSARQDNAVAAFVSYDQWQQMYKRPIRDTGGVLPPTEGIVYTGMTGRDILVEWLTASDTYDGATFIDYTLGVDRHQTAVIDEFTVQQGMTIGEGMDELVNTGTIDIRLTPAMRVAGLTFNDLETYPTDDTPTIGVYKPNVIMSWDRPGRTLVGIDNEYDGAGRVNAVRYHFGQGGDAAATLEDAASQARFGTYFGEQFFPGQVSEAGVAAMAAKTLSEFANGRRTILADIASDRGKQPFVDYMPGDIARVFASSALLEPIDERRRILSIPINIDDNSTESVERILFSQDGFAEPT